MQAIDKLKHTARCQFWAGQVSKYGVISGPYFPVSSPNTGKYGPEITPYLDTFHTVWGIKYQMYNYNFF